MFATATAALCEIEPNSFTEIQSKEDAAYAISLCNQCEYLLICRDYAERFRWQNNIVIAGWQAPRTKPTYPPWSPLHRPRR